MWLGQHAKNKASNKLKLNLNDWLKKHKKEQQKSTTKEPKELKNTARSKEEIKKDRILEAQMKKKS